MNRIKTNFPCLKCGKYNQMELQREDGQWQVQCLSCGKIMPLKDEDVPKEFNPRQYETQPIKSSFEVSTTFSLSHLGITPPSRMWGNSNRTEF